MKRIIATVFTLLIGLLAWNGDASAFCGFYVAKADTKLFNKASEVTIARHDNKTVITMADDFKGDVKEFAMVVPVPTILEFGRIGKGMPMAQNVFLTRLHVRYDAAHFPEDLIFQETTDRSSFHARYILRHPWNGTDDCAAATAYRQQLRDRHEKEAQPLANLTGWQISEIRKAMQLASGPLIKQKKWYERLWNN